MPDGFDGAGGWGSLILGAVVREILPPLETIEGEIASAIAGAILASTSVFQVMLSSMGMFGGPVGAVISWAIGAIVDLLFDKDPEAWTNVGFDAATGHFVLTGTTSHDGGDTSLSQSLAQAYVNGMNAFVDTMMSQSNNYGDLAQWSFGHFENALKNAGQSGQTFASFQDAYLDAYIRDLAAVQLNDGQMAAVRALSNLNLDIILSNEITGSSGENRTFYEIQVTHADGSMSVDVVEDGTQVQVDLPDGSTICIEVHGTGLPPEVAILRQMVVSPGDVHSYDGKNPIGIYQMIAAALQIASDYHTYLENTEAINALIAAAPDTAFAAGWYATLAEAKRLGLTDAYSVTGSGADNAFYTAEGNDSVAGGAGNDIVVTYLGDDSLYGEAGNDLLKGGAGHDLIDGGTENDTIFGGSGDDSISGGSGDDRIDAGQGADEVDGGAGTDWLDHTNSTTGVSVNLDLGLGLAGEAVGDVISGIENLLGGTYGDTLIGDNGANEIDGASGNDLLKGSFGNDSLKGGTGNDNLLGDRGDGQAAGGADQLYGGDGNDTLHGDGGADTLDGGLGQDVASYEFAHSAVIASLESNEGLTGADRDQFSSIEGLTGSTFADELTGDNQANTLRGGRGADTLDGGGGNDTYSYTLGDGSDVIHDWDSTGNTDRLVISGALAADVVFRQDANENLIITFGDHAQIAIEDQFLGALTFNSIEEITFSDGTTLGLAEIREKMVADMKATGNVIGTDLAETYYHNVGDGTYAVSDYDGNGRTDTLVLNGTGSTGFTLARDSEDDLLIKFSNGGTITVVDQFQSDHNYWGIEELVLGDGTVMDLAGIRARMINDMKATGSVIGTQFADSYVHNSGDGSYTILDYDTAGRSDSITFTDKASTQVSLVQDGNNLLLITNSGETITVLQQFNASGFDRVETFHFSDGVVWQASDLAAHLTSVSSAPGQIVGTVANDTYSNSAGDGSIGITDYNYYHGTDTLHFADQIADDLTFNRSGNDLILTRSNGETVTLHRQLDTNQAYSIEQLTFSDGSTMSEAQMRNRLVSDMKATGQVVGTSNDETYRHATGDGSYSISDYNYYSGNDVLILSDANVSDIHLSRSGDDLLLKLAGDETITLINQLDGTLHNGIEHLVFADGTSFSEAQIRDRLVADMKASGYVVGTERDENYYHALGDGSYTISDYDYNIGADRLTLSDSSASTIHFARSGNDLQIILSNGETITLERQLDDNLHYGIETLVFSDGTSLTAAQIRDRLVADMKKDGLAVGTENSETYYHTKGDGSWMIQDYDYYHGSDRLVFTNATASEITLSRHDNALILQLSNGESITILDQLDNDLRRSIEFFEFSDGTVLTEAQIRDRMVSDMKATGNVVGTENSETYVHTTGDGSYKITDYDYDKGADRLIFTDVIAGQVILSRTGDDMTLKLPNGEIVTIVGQLMTNLRNSIETFQFSDGTVLSIGQMLTKLTADMKASGLVVGAGATEVFTHHRGDGSYTISDNTADADRLDFADVMVSEVAMSRVGTDLAIRLLANGEVVTISKYFESHEYKMASVSFADGTTLSTAQLDLVSSWRTIIGGSGSDTLVGEADADSLTGGAGADVLYGGAGNDILVGGTGADSMFGGHGDDLYDVDNSSDQLFEDPADGTDTVISSVTWSLASAFENLTLSGSLAISGFGNASSNIIVGNGASNNIAGLDGDDTLSGGLGDDTLDGGTGADSLVGGDGNDSFVVDNASDVVVELSGQGVDIVSSSVSWTLDAFVENLTLTGAAAIGGTGNAAVNILVGNANDNALSGQDGNDTITAGDGNDTLDGGTGVDSLTGGLGDDTYVVDDSGDKVIEATGGGLDTVQSSITYTLGTDVENLTLTGAAAINGTGNTLANVMIGNNGANLLSGSSGNDSLAGGGGADTLDGGTGTDSLSGGTGDDTYVVDTTADVVVEAAGEGADVVQSSVAWTLGNNVENLTLTGTSGLSGTGNADANTLTGNTGANILAGLEGDDTILAGNGNDTLDGGVGADSMVGGLGNDTYVVDAASDTVVENAGEGTDLVQSSVSYTLGAELENLTLTDTAAINGTGNAVANTLIGNAAANLLAGLAGADTITSGDGNDTLDGGTGVDSMTGGLGDDLYVVDDVNDKVIEATSGGTDSVQSSVTFTLATNVENLTLLGTTAIDAIGNASANVLTGNDAANAFTGGTGNDTAYGGAGADTLDGGYGGDALFGGLGDDLYLVDDVTDTVTENAAEGTDLVQSSVNWTLSANVENLTLTGAVGLSGTGNADANILTGNSGANSLFGMDGADTILGGSGNDTLDGGAGGDSLVGGLGNDTFVIDTASDVIVENAGEGTDLVLASVTITLGSDVENLTLTGPVAIDGTGNTAANTLTGNTEANLLSGLAGNDTITASDGNDTLDGGIGVDSLMGGLGDDLYVVDDANDKVIEAASSGTDTVQSSASFTLGTNVENLILTGSAAIDGTGTTAVNIMTGNSGANLLSASNGNDTVFGGGGADTLDGGSGADSLTGGTGDDTYVVDDASDVLVEAASEGTDLVQSSIAWTLATNFENLTLTGAFGLAAVGNAAGNVLTGNTGSNSLSGLDGNDTIFGGGGNDAVDGGLGNDSLVGGTGNDTYTVDSLNDVIVENAAEGTDLVQTGLTYTLGAEVENLTQTGSASINGTGNAVANLLTGNTGDNLLAGLGGNDTITSSDGNDTLDGGTGVDSMTGGLGDDLYIVDDAADKTIELSTGGTDSVQSSVTYTIATSIENLTLTGAAAIVGTGNTSANILTGNGAANALYGGSGADTLYGGTGNDTLDGGATADSMAGGTGDDLYMVDLTTDILTEATSEGTDTVSSGVAWTLGTNFENLTLSGSAGNAGTGNTLANIIIGNSGANALSGLAGDDTITGGAGNDTVTGGTGADQFVFTTAANGIDVISDFNEVDGVGGEEGDVLRFDAASKVGVFVYLGTGAFSGGSDNSEARVSGNQVLVDINGDTVVDITITLTGLTNATALQLAASDFLFV